MAALHPTSRVVDYDVSKLGYEVSVRVYGGLQRVIGIVESLVEVLIHRSGEILIRKGVLRPGFHTRILRS
jgi:hypothetical protein